MGTITFSELKRCLAAEIAAVQAADQALVLARVDQEMVADPEEGPSERVADLLRQAAVVRTIEQQARASAGAALQVAEPWLQRQADIAELLEDLDPIPRTT